MPHVSAAKDILPNPYFKSLDRSFDNVFKKYLGRSPKNRYIVFAPCYNNLDLEKIHFEPADYFSSRLIHAIKESNIKIIFDCSGEGSYEVFPYFKYFHKSILSQYFINNFFYLTGCPHEKTFHQQDNIYHINSLDILVKEFYTPSYESDITNYFSCLTRKPRYWRSKLIYKLLNNESLNNKFIFSHPKITKDNFFMNHTFIEHDMQDFFLNREFEQITPSQPLVPNMPFRDVISTIPDVYSRVAFDLTMETYQDGATEYITEKTFKPILNLTPTLIWGTPGINTVGLGRLGFKTYEDWFDLSFDLEPDTEKRLNLLLAEINRVCKKIEEYGYSAWKNKNVEILEHNKNLILNLLPTNKSEISRLIDNLEQY